MSSTQAFWFGPPERRAFGSYHASAGRSRAMGVVLCPPLGHELLSMHRAVRHLAERLAALGFPALRIDYHGTGDSAGDDLDERRVEQWLATIDDGVALLRSAGVREVALFGIRAGATLAAWAARKNDVSALALVAPSVSGSAFLRELRAMHAIRARGLEQRDFRGRRDGDEEAIGFVLRRRTIEALGEIDLRRLAEKPAEHVLVVPRDDVPGGEARVVDRLRALGATVDVVNAPGYAALAANDPYDAKVPDTIWSVVTGWLEAANPERRFTTSLAPQATERVAVDEHVEESVVRFGPNGSLFGILTQSSEVARRSDFAVVVSNTGANSRVSPHRLNVKLARRLAARGCGVLRMDIAGVGDSPPRDGAENELYRMESVDDVRAAVDVLGVRGYRRFVAAGLCTGAYLSLHAALVDPRIGAIALMNPLALEWRPGDKVDTRPRRGNARAYRSTRYYTTRALQVETWKRLITGEVDATGIARALGSRFRDRAALMVGVADATTTAVSGKFEALAKRGVKVLVVFDAEEPTLDDIGTWRAPRARQVEIIDGTDHTFAPVWSHERVFDVLLEFVQSVRADQRNASDAWLTMLPSSGSTFCS